MQVIVDNLAISYERTGKGRVILLLHGWGDSRATYYGLIEHLAAQFEVIAPDLPGFGDSEAPQGVWGLDQYSIFLSNFIDKLDIKEIYAIIGHSNGGALAIKAIANKRLKPKKLVLLAASGIRDSHKIKRILIKIIAKAGKALTFWLPQSYKRTLRLKLYGTIGSDLLVMPNLEATFKKTVREDVQLDAINLKLPVLLIYADHDPAIPLNDGKRYHELMSNSKLEILNSSSHFIHHDQQEKVINLIKAFL